MSESHENHMDSRIVSGKSRNFCSLCFLSIRESISKFSNLQLQNLKFKSAVQVPLDDWRLGSLTRKCNATSLAGKVFREKLFLVAVRTTNLVNINKIWNRQQNIKTTKFKTKSKYEKLYLLKYEMRLERHGPPRPSGHVQAPNRSTSVLRRTNFPALRAAANMKRAATRCNFELSCSNSQKF